MLIDQQRDSDRHSAYHDPITTIEALIEGADRAFYLAKEAGRNQVCILEDAS